MPAYRWTGSAYRDLATGIELGGDPWGAPDFHYNFSNLTDWNVRDNFSTIDTARAVTANAVAGPDGLHLLGTWLPDAPVAGGPKGFYTHNTGYVDQRDLVDAANPTPHHYSQEFGRWEVRCQTPTGDNTRGALAAFWLRNEGGLMGEIDILESWGGPAPAGTASEYDTWVKGSAVTSFHNNTNGAGAAPVNGKGYRKAQWRHFEHGVPRGQVYSQMNTYSFVRMPDYISLHVNGVEVFNVTPTSTDPNNTADTLWWLWDPDFFGGPMQMRINLHIGPNENYYGLPDPEQRELTVDPLDYHIEHVKVWRYVP